MTLREVDFNKRLENMIHLIHKDKPLYMYTTCQSGLHTGKIHIYQTFCDKRGIKLSLR